MYYRLCNTNAKGIKILRRAVLAVYIIKLYQLLLFNRIDLVLKCQ